MSTYEIKLTTLSPLHIGAGEELRQDFDFTVIDNRTYRLNQDAILDAYFEQWRRNPRLLPGKLLRPEDYNRPDFFRYDMKGFPRSAKIDARLQACIKDVYDRPYIPGSSLKGAMRTALGWAGWKESGIRFDRSMVGYKKQWAGQKLEQRLFGSDPNHDLLRALQVGDCFGPQKAGEKLMLVNVQVLTANAAQSPIELEAISGDVTFHGQLNLDETLFSKTFERELKFGNRKHWLDELVPRLQNHSTARIQELLTWFEKNNIKYVADFYQRLSNASLSKNQALLQLGWGTGWDGKTFGTHLQQDQPMFNKIVQDFRMQKVGKRGGYSAFVNEFPNSKRVVMSIQKSKGIPAAPLGWVLLELNKK